MVLTAQEDELLVDGRIEFRGVFDTTRRPCVTVSDVPMVDVPTICPNLEPGIAALADYLRVTGHRRVAMLSVPGDEHRLHLFGEHFGAADVPVFRSSADSNWPTRGAGEALARSALRSEDRPTALIALSDVVAAGALDAAHALGLRVPEDVTIVGIDDTPGGADTLGLTTIVVPYRPMGELAASTLLRWIDGGERPADPPPLPTALSIRHTSGRAPAKA
jgi:DNA-binding LacI/PurR family transcriptional regulator